MVTFLAPLKRAQESMSTAMAGRFNDVLKEWLDDDSPYRVHSGMPMRLYLPPEPADNVAQRRAAAETASTALTWSVSSGLFPLRIVAAVPAPYWLLSRASRTSRTGSKRERVSVEQQ